MERMLQLEDIARDLPRSPSPPSSMAPIRMETPHCPSLDIIYNSEPWNPGCNALQMGINVTANHYGSPVSNGWMQCLAGLCRGQWWSRLLYVYIPLYNVYSVPQFMSIWAIGQMFQALYYNLQRCTVSTCLGQSYIRVHILVAMQLYMYIHACISHSIHAWTSLLLHVYIYTSLLHKFMPTLLTPFFSFL